jgi:ABC-2 type transport system ATP-binding protein
MSGTAIATHELTKRFGTFVAVDHVSFDVREGELFGFLGPNGAGKSTTIRLLCTLALPTEGSATVAGFDVVRDAAEVREHIGLVSEKLIMYNDLTARENLRLFGRLYDLPRDRLDARIDELLRLVRMETWADTRVGRFSTGMKQRINVVRALVNEPEILFMDEPTLGLDPQSTVEIRTLIKRINQQLRTTIILTTHTMVDADLLCDRIGIIDQGRIIALDTSPNLKRRVESSESTTFEFDVLDPSPTALSAVRALPFVVSVDLPNPTRLVVRANGSEAFGTLFDTLRANRVRVVGGRSLEPTLEDVFLFLTGGRAIVPSNGKATTPTPGGRRWAPVPAARVR